MTAVCHQRKQRLRQEERPLEVDPEEAVERLFSDGLDRLVDPVSRVVDEGIEALRVPVPGQHGPDAVTEGREAGAVSHVELQCRRLATGGLNRRDDILGGGCIAIVSQDDAHPAIGTLDGRAGPKAPASAGDDDDTQFAVPLFG